jgi:hypothetical protein
MRESFRPGKFLSSHYDPGEEIHFSSPYFSPKSKPIIKEIPMTAPSSADLFGKLMPPAQKAVSAPPAPPALESEDAPATQVTELEMLKNRARLMGVTFSNNIGVEALRARVQAKLDGEQVDKQEPAQEEIQEAPQKSVAPAQADAPKAPVKSFRQQQIEEQMRLVRLRITNLDPRKKDLPGEIFTFANRVIGGVKKFIPYGAVTDNGYHVPYCIYQQLKEREFVNITTRKNSKGQMVVESAMAREFALEVLEPLTTAELSRLAAAQAAAAGQD